MAIKYKWLASELRNKIDLLKEQGIDKLPSEAEIGERYEVSRQTVRQALLLLEGEGLIEKKQGSGSFITGRSLQAHQNEIAILITSEQDYLYPILIADIQLGLRKAGFSSSVYVTDNRVDKERELLEKLFGNVGGLIVEGVKSALPNPNLDLYRRYIQHKIPLLFLHNFYPGLNQVVAVKDNNYQGASALVTHLKEKGHQKIAGFFPSDDMQGLERYSGYIETLRLYHLDIKDDYVGWFHRKDLLNLERNQNTLFIDRFIEDCLLKQDCTAIVCYNDEVAYYLIRQLKKLHLFVPEDLAVTSFDNSYLALEDATGITSMSHQTHEMGTKAADAMIDLLKGKQIKTQELPWMIRARGSS